MGWLEDLLQIGVGLRFAAIGAYAGAFAGYAGSLGSSRKKWFARAASILALIGVVAHTAYLLDRWAAAGQIEILARERSGDVLSASDRIWYMVSHPPFTNLFDALNFTGWALMACWLLFQRKWGVQVLGALAAAVALVAMGEASLVTDQQIEPLVPALQSYWILIHVAMLFVSYALFTLGAAASLLYLVRAGTPTRVLGAAQAGLAALMLALVGGTSLLTGAFEMAPSWVHQVPSRLRPGKFLDVVGAVHVLSETGKQVKLMLPVPYVGPFLLLAFVLFIAAAIVYWRKADSAGLKLAFSGFAALTVGLVVLLVQIALSSAVTLPAGVRAAPGETGPYFFGIASNYALGLLSLVWGTVLGFLITAVWRSGVEGLLPEAAKLEALTYRTVIIGWPLLGLGIVMGGVWANEAWGRFWGWDPKETWALITWVVYAGYLHTRMTMGWTGKRTAAIAVGAFAVVIFTFLGVNLGLTGDGLHSYGAG